MTVQVTPVRTTEPAQTEWTGSTAAVHQDLMEDSVNQVTVHEQMKYFSSVLVSFVSSRELVRLDLRHVTRSPSIGKRIWVGRYNNAF